MTLEEKAEAGYKSHAGEMGYNDGTRHKLYFDGFKDGFKAGRPMWHDLRKNPEDLPETLHPVYAKLDSGTYVFAYCVNKIWHENDDGIILYHGNGKSKVIAWCEIPKFEE